MVSLIYQSGSDQNSACMILHDSQTFSKRDRVELNDEIYKITSVIDGNTYLIKKISPRLLSIQQQFGDFYANNRPHTIYDVHVEYIEV